MNQFQHLLCIAFQYSGYHTIVPNNDVSLLHIFLEYGILLVYISQYLEVLLFQIFLLLFRPIVFVVSKVMGMMF